MIMEVCEKVFLGAKDVQELLGVKRCKAYELIKIANTKLAEAGKLTVRGKVDRKFFMRLLDTDDVAL